MATWLQRRKAQRRLRDTVGLWYHPQYRVEALGETARVPGIEIARSEKVLGALGADGLVGPKQVRPAGLIGLGDLARVHSEAYLDQTARPESLGRIFGLEAHFVGFEDEVWREDRVVVAHRVFLPGWPVDGRCEGEQVLVAPSPSA